MKKLITALTMGLSLLLAVFIVISQAGTVQPPDTLHSAHHFLPPYPNPRDRFGFDVSGSMSGYDVERLNAGWYSNWGASADPAHPDGLTYVQMIRFSAGSDSHDPDQISVSPNRTTIARIAAAHPGSLWMLSNEPDSQYQGNPIYPDVYAHVYHEFYHYIKGLDPTALIANGGIVQPTPCRMEYLDIVLETYEQAYSTTMPVDVWNIHAFTLREVYGSWGASTPPGVDKSCGIDYDIRDADDIGLFRDNLIAFRQWMKDHGQQNKPLIISEYGILWPNWLTDEDGRGFPPSRVSHFMTQTFDLFLNEIYPSVGYPADNYRLVQAWAWYSLSSDDQYNGHLFNSSSKTISSMGETYADYTAGLNDPRYTDLAVQIWPDWSPLEAMPAGSSAVTIPVDGSVTNLGKSAAANVVITSPLMTFQHAQDVPGRYTADTGKLPLPSLVLTQPKVYNLSLTADPLESIDDPRRWNNAITATVDALPDLSIPTTTWNAWPTGVQSSTLSITMTVGNQNGLWASPAVSVTMYLSDAHGTLLISPRKIPIPSIGSGDVTTVVDKVTLSDSQGAMYRLKLVVDEEDSVPERDEANNQTEIDLDTRPDLIAPAHVLGYNLGDGRVRFHIPITNEGNVDAPPTSGTLGVTTTQGSLLLPGYRFSIPRLNKKSRVTLTEVLGLYSSFDEDLLRLTVDVDSDDALVEQSEENNYVDLTAPIVMTTTMQPDAKTVLTSSSRRMTFLFPAGVVTEPAEIHFTPRLTSELPSGPLLGVEAFSLDAYQDGQPITVTNAPPITITWRYTDTDVNGLDEEALGLYYLNESGHWERVRCSEEKSQPGSNQLVACIQHLSTFAFGQGYELYIPIAIAEGDASAAEVQSTSPDEIIPGSPLRLPPWATPPGE